MYVLFVSQEVRRKKRESETRIYKRAREKRDVETIKCCFIFSYVLLLIMYIYMLVLALATYDEI